MEHDRVDWGRTWLEDVRRDVSYAFRGLLRHPTFSVVATLTLALGIGATTITFSVVNAVLLALLPYPNPGHLVQIVENVPAAESPNGVAMRLTSINEDEFDWWRSRTTTLSHMALLIPESRTMATREGTIRLPSARVSPALFPMLGIQPVLGRWLREDEERADAAVAVLSTDAWRRYFGSDRGVLEQPIVLDGRAHTIVGVMPPEFDLPARDTAVWVPHSIEPRRPGLVSIVGMLARVRQNVSIEAAAEEANTLGHVLRDIAPRPEAPPRFEVVGMADQLAAPVRPALRVLVVAVALVLLIVCANVANLLLVRGASRTREIAVRAAMGAARTRLIRQLLTESLVLSMMGCVAGAALTIGGIRVLRGWSNIELPAVFSRVERATGGILPRADQIAVDGTILAFALGVSLFTGLAFGIAPALRNSRMGPHGAWPASGAHGGSGTSEAGPIHIGRVLAISQLTMATALLVGAGLLMHGFIRLAAVDSGFDPEGVVHFQLVVPHEQALEDKLQDALDLTVRLQALPRVEAAGFTNSPPLVNSSLYASVVPPAMTDQEFLAIPRRERPQMRTVSPGYLPAMGIRLLEGRWLTDEDRPGRPRVVLVNRAYVRRYLSGRNPLGTELKQGNSLLEVVGVVDDIRMRTLDGVIEPVVFTDTRQTLSTLGQAVRGPGLDMMILGPTGSVSFAVRLRDRSASIASELQALVAQVDARAAVEGLAAMDDVVAGTIARPRFYAFVMSAFGAIAGLLAAVGIYGVLAYMVVQRTKEIGIRLAIGGSPKDVRRLILRQGGGWVAAGVASGLAVALGLSRYLEGMLYGLTAVDPATYMLVAAIFALIGLFACYVPARRATKVDPLLALRAE